MSEAEVEYLNVQADSEFDQGDRVQIMGLDGTIRSLKYSVFGPDSQLRGYTVIRNDHGGEVAVRTDYLRRVGSIQ